MISTESRTREWIMDIRGEAPGKDPILIEKMIMALTLAESLKLAGLDYIFKGCTSLLLLLDSPRRFSIDIDIVLPDPSKLEDCFKKVLTQGAFSRFEESKRTGEIPKQHFKFFYPGVIQTKESHILLDILFEENLYPKLVSVDIQSSMVAMDGQVTEVVCPARECLLGDKLTAYAPHTTGIPYGKGKDLEMAKQLFDVAVLFDVVEDLYLVRSAFSKIATRELAYRGMKHQSLADVLWDSIDTSFMISSRGVSCAAEYAEFAGGIKKMSGFVYSGSFSIDSAIVCASKAAYLSALIMKEVRHMDRFRQEMDLSSWTISNQHYNKLNKLKKTNPEAFYYFFRTIALLELDHGA